MDDKALAELLDKQAIFELVRTERFWRDQGEWEKLAGAYVEDSWIRTTWFEGNGRDFTDASREMAQRGRHSKHPIAPIWARINGDRALVESNAEIQNRSIIEGIEVDTVQYCRFFSRVRRTPDGWRLSASRGSTQRTRSLPPTPPISCRSTGTRCASCARRIASGPT
jgi:hypothetical protein